MFVLIITKNDAISHNLILFLIKKGYKIRIIYHKKKIFNRAKSKITCNIELIYGNIFDVNFLNNIMKDIDYVYHNYSSGYPLFTCKKYHEIFYDNIYSTYNIVNAALNNKIKKLIYISSSYSLGYIVKSNVMYSNEYYNVNKVYDYMCIYSQSIYLSENEIWRGIAEGLNAIIINPTNIIDSNEYPNIMYAVYNNSTNLVLKKDCYNGYIGLQDVITASVKLMESSISGEKFLLNAENIKLNYIIDILLKNNKYNYLYNKILNLLNYNIYYKTINNIINRNIIYSNNKIIKAINIKFTPIKNIINLFLKKIDFYYKF